MADSSVDSCEYKTIVNCTKSLETAFRSIDRDIVHFLYQEGFISQEVNDDVLNPRSMLTAHQKASQLVTGIRNKVELRASNFHTLVEHLRQRGKYYESIVDILDMGYISQLQESAGIAPALQLPSVPRQKLSQALSRYGKYLKSYYSSYSIARDDKLAIAPCNQFINLALIKKEAAQEKSKIPIDIDTVVVPGFPFILVEGLPGMGKSTLCWEFCRRWEDLESLHHYNIVLQLRLRERRIQNATELTEIFFHRDKKLCQSVVDEVLECEGEGVLLILDGLEEMPISSIRHHRDSSLVVELLNGVCLPNATRLVTSRPSVLHHKRIFPEDYRHVEILGFTDECKVQFAEITFKSEPDVFIHFRNFIFSNAIITSLMYIPINCAIIAQVYKDIRRSTQLVPKTMTELYHILVLVLIRRRMIEKGKWDEDSRIPKNLKDLPTEILSDLKKVSELAYRGLMSDVQLVFTDEEVGEGFEHLGLLSEAKEMYVHEGVRSFYSFLHLSIQEFLAAWHLAYNPNLIPEASSLFLGTESLGAFGKFVAGLLGCDMFPMKEGMTKHTVYMVHCLYEAQESCKSLADHAFPECMLYKSQTPLDMYTFGYILVHAPIEWNLHVDGYSDVSLLVNGIEKSRHVSGIISKLAIGSCRLPSSLSRFMELPASLLEQVSELGSHYYCSMDDTPTPLPTKWMSSLRRLHTLELHGWWPLEDSHSLYQAIRSYPNLKHFEVTLFPDWPPMDEVKLLANSLASSRTLERALLDHDSSDCADPIELCYLVEAVLTCPTLKTLDTDILFCTANDMISPKLENIKFTVFNSEGNETRLTDCLCCIATLCQRPTMRSLEIVYGDDYYYPALEKFLPILNRSLYYNSSFEVLKLNLRLSSNYLRSTLSNSLGTHPSLLSWKRSKSLGDLSTVDNSESDYFFTFETVSHFGLDLDLGKDLGLVDPSARAEPDRWQSCLDMTQMQGLHGAHPLLCEALDMNRIYCEEHSEEFVVNILFLLCSLCFRR